MIDLVFRCFSRARWITVATSRGIYDAEGTVSPGFEVDEIGAVELVPAVIDGLGVVTTPAVLDTWFWVNLRTHGGGATLADADTLYPGEIDEGYKFTKSKLVRFVREQATPVNLTYRGQTIRTYQFGATVNRVQLLDPRDYAVTRVREWLGGMEF